jgi:MurNAc alpha-1-phosphate uridylyltransferase
VLVPNPPHVLRGDFWFERNRMIEPVPGMADDTDVAARIAALPRYTFSGLGVYEPSLFNGCTDGVFRLAPLLRTAAAAGRASAELFEGDWLDIGTPARLDELNRRLGT